MKWLLLLTLASCAQITSLNLQKHQFGILPIRIVWLQVAGLEEEHISMLRFNKSSGYRTSFEQNTCLGKSWSYNLFELRPSARDSFLSQITGKKNISGTCEDSAHQPIWTYLKENNYETGILENSASDKNAIISFNQCGEKGLTFLSNTYQWQRLSASEGTETWNQNDISPVQNKIFYNRSCSKKSCNSTLNEDAAALYEKMALTSRRHVFIIRDFSYLEAIEKKDFTKARDILFDLEKTYAHFLKITKDSSETLLLLTTADSRYIDSPDQGKAWYELDKNGVGLQAKRPELLNMVLASGARAENFCGIFDDSDVFTRILSGPKQQGLELRIINPFSR